MGMPLGQALRTSDSGSLPGWSGNLPDNPKTAANAMSQQAERQDRERSRMPERDRNFGAPVAGNARIGTNDAEELYCMEWYLEGYDRTTELIVHCLTLSGLKTSDIGRALGNPEGLIGSAWPVDRSITKLVVEQFGESVFVSDLDYFVVARQ